ncbi:hypothetical protein D3C83_268870 [compost metagenome]
MNAIFLGLSSANRMMGPTWSLLTVLTRVVTRTIWTPALYRLSIALSFTSNRLPTFRWLFASFPIPSNCR